MLSSAPLLALLSVAPVPVQTPAERPTHRITRIPEEASRPTIDGALDEPIWATANALTDFRQASPVEGAKPSERTEVRLLYDEESIYLGVTCFDSSPSEIRATVQKRDAGLMPDDAITILLDPFQDEISGYGFGVGAAGGRLDGSVDKGGQLSRDVNYEWSAVTRIGPEGWVAEIEIPFFNFNMETDRPAWGFNIQRVIKRRLETVRWSAPRSAARVLAPAYAGVLVGLGEEIGGSDLEVRPFLLGDYSKDRSSDDEGWDSDAGLDLIYKLTPSTKLTLSLNTDFAETEVDDRLVNLTRFPLFFPERRDFFLEDAGIFTFGPPSRRGNVDLLPFFSRRIGLDASGEEVPILGAVKLTAETSGHRYGVLDVQTDSEGQLDSQNLFAGRYSKNILEQSDVGVLVTAGDPQDRGRESTIGADLNYRTTSFMGDDNLALSAYALHTEADDVSEGNNAYLLSASYPNDVVELFGSLTVLEDNFDPALGFAPRTGIKKYQSAFAWRPRPHTMVRQYDFRAEPTLITDSGNATETVRVLYRPLGITYESGDSFEVDIEQRREILDQNFPIVPGSVIAPGSYDFLRYGARAESSDKREFSGSAEFFTGDFFDGERDDYLLGFDWRPGHFFTLETRYELNQIELPTDDFDVHIGRAKINFQFSTDLTWSNYVQWDDQTELLGVNSRLRWSPEDGRELNFVINQGWLTVGSATIPDETSVTLKIAYTFRR